MERIDSKVVNKPALNPPNQAEIITGISNNKKDVSGLISSLKNNFRERITPTLNIGSR
jgi:hypothetical protein